MLQKVFGPSPVRQPKRIRFTRRHGRDGGEPPFLLPSSKKNSVGEAGTKANLDRIMDPRSDRKRTVQIERVPQSEPTVNTEDLGCMREKKKKTPGCLFL